MFLFPALLFSAHFSRDASYSDYVREGAEATALRERAQPTARVREQVQHRSKSSQLYDRTELYSRPSRRLSLWHNCLGVFGLLTRNVYKAYVIERDGVYAKTNGYIQLSNLTKPVCLTNFTCAF